MTTFRWDHTVHYVNDLEAVREAFGKYGLVAEPGGRHVGHGTKNALAYFGLNYVEFLTIDDAEQLKPDDPSELVFSDAANYLPDSEGFSRVALRVHDIDEAWQELRDKGLAVSPIAAGNRTTPQGQELRWRIFTISGTDGGLPYPFVIDWQVPDDVRLGQLAGSGLLGKHAQGEVTTSRAVIEVDDPAALAHRWAELFGLSPVSPTELGIGEQVLQFVPGPANAIVELVFGVAPGPGDDTPAGPGFDFRLGGARYRSES
ncbi:hypothetical protein GCM10009785_11560 [Brooklawnia cerclae]|uniref:VOC domain-containing protein n=1 Tax=Brooklawnia cerclae TaxID=349934 RepID=A0ABX0SP92_9ACTN|nr:VOC family protein [Brooklawnia cerclae]NIH58616.1 hypothetical protein [Brooklawnia cerclae]